MDIILDFLVDTFSVGLPYVFLALGIFVSYRLLDFADLTTEGSFALGGGVAIVAILLGVNPFIATMLAIISGFLAGVITGVLHTIFKIPSLLSGILTMTGLFSINMVILGIGYSEMFTARRALPTTQTDNVKTIYETFLGFFEFQDYNIIFISIIIIIIWIIALYWFFGTELGMSVRSTGMNQRMSRAQGINTTIMIIIGLGISNALIATGGALISQGERYASNDRGSGTLVIGLASIILGETIFGKRSFKNWIISVALGAVVYYSIINLALEIGLPSQLLRLLYAVTIVLILVFTTYKKQINKAFKPIKSKLRKN